MMEAWTDKSQILIAIPLLGAALGLAFWPMPRALKIWALLVTGAEFLALYAVSGTPSGHTVSAPLILLLILVAALAILGQIVHEQSLPRYPVPETRSKGDALYQSPG